jgi:hypothetical protein
MMELQGKWAIVNNDMVVIALFEGDILSHDISNYERYGGEVGYHYPNEHRGPVSVGMVWNIELDKFE